MYRQHRLQKSAPALALALSALLSLTASGVSVASPTTGATQPVAKVESVEDLSQWMAFYYLHPQPDLVVAALKFADQNGLMDAEHLPPLQAFVSRIFAENPQKIAEWYAQMEGMKEQNRLKLLTAVWWSDTSQGKQMLDAIAKTLPEKAQTEFNQQIKKKAPAIDAMEIDSPVVLDMLWACFCATGDEKYVKRLMVALPWSKDEKNLNHLILSSAAKWSLKSNAEQHPKVMRLCKTTMSENAELKPYLEKIVSDIENKNNAGSHAGGKKAASRQQAR